MHKIAESLWRKPPIEYRPLLWWAWNDKLTKNEITRQLKDYSLKKFGGVFMHSRIGLVTPYLSDEWMDLIKHTVSLAGRNDIQTHIYDEDRWPSGFAGGKVPEMHPDARKKVLVYDRDNDRIRIVPVQNSAWYNGKFSCDLLSRKVTESFIKTTHERYKKVIGKNFGKQVKIVFTDEPGLYPEHFEMVGVSLERVPWSDSIVPAFKKIYGYDIRRHLRKLFFNEGNFRLIRYQFYLLITVLFRDNYFKPIHEWCRKNDLNLTGHLLMEETLSSQIQSSGAVMPHYEYMQIPAIDHLGSSNRQIAVVIKQVSSVGRQLGKYRVLSEIFGGSGWDMSFRKMKHTGEFNYVLGVNSICLHISYYSTRGCRKNDWPPSFSYHQPYWKDFKRFNDYFARLSYMLTHGESVCNTLLLHPIGSAWSVFTPVGKDPVKKLYNELNDIVYRLLGNHVDFDFGDEIIIEKHGKIKHGKFCIGRMQYDVVIVPPSLTWTKNTCTMLMDFLESGGKVIWIRPAPDLVEAREDSILRMIITHKNSIVVSKGNLISVIETTNAKKIQIKGKDNALIFCQHRKTENEDIYFLVNTSLEKKCKLRCVFPGKDMNECDPYTGKINKAPVSLKNGNIELTVFFDAGESKLFIVPQNVPPTVTFKASDCKKEQSKIYLDGVWSLEKKSPNTLLMEYVQYCLGSGTWSSIVPVQSSPAAWNFQDTVERIAHRLYHFPWEIRLETMFFNELKSWRSKEVYFCLEDMPKYISVKVNGQEIKGRRRGWWIDRGMAKVDIRDLLVRGVNKITLRARYRQSHDFFSMSKFYQDGFEFERCYIVGDFAVEKMKGSYWFKMTEEAANVNVQDDLCLKGYPFFTGTVRLSRDFILSFKPEEAYFNLKSTESNVIKLFVNGSEVETLLWPKKVAIGKRLGIGRNNIALELTNTLGSIWGELHCPPTYNDPAHWVSKYNFKKFGIGKPPEITMLGG